MMREHIEHLIRTAEDYLNNSDAPDDARRDEIRTHIAAMQEVMPSLHDERTLNDYVDTAREMYIEGDDVEIDVAPLISEAGDKTGYWINSWMFVRHSDVRESTELNMETNW